MYVGLYEVLNCLRTILKHTIAFVSFTDNLILFKQMVVVLDKACDLRILPFESNRCWFCASHRHLK